MASSRKKSGQSQRTKRQATFDFLMQSDEPLVEAIRNFDDEDFIESNDSTQTIPQEYCLISEAVHKLEKSMFGNLNRPDAVLEIKKVQRDASIGLSSHREAAKRLILKAAVKGKLIVYRLRPNVSAIEPIEPRFISKIMLVRSG